MSLARVAWVAAIISAMLSTGVGDLRAAGTSATKPQPRAAPGNGEINFDGTPLVKVIDFFRNLTGLNIIVNWKSLEAAGVTRDTPITLQVHDLSVGKMLQLVLSQASPNAPLSYVIDSNVLQITTQEDLDRQLITKVYIVDDLVLPPNNNAQAPRINLNNLTQNSGGSGFGGGGGGMGGGGGYGSGGGGGGGLFNSTNTTNTSQNQPTPAQKGQELVDAIKATIRPNIWKDNGGPADIKYYNGKLIVTAPASVHEAIGGPVGSAGIHLGM